MDFIEQLPPFSVLLQYSLSLIMLSLTQVEANVNLKSKDEWVLEGRLQERRMLGASAATLGNDRLP